MDSSNAERAAREAYIAFHEGLSGFDAARAWDDMTSPADDWSQEAIDWTHAVKVALASRDAEVAELTAENEKLRSAENLLAMNAIQMSFVTSMSMDQAAAFIESIYRQATDRRRAQAIVAEVAELREQLAAAEAVIEKVREAHGERFADTGRITTGADARMGVALNSAPSVVLEDRDREVAARALEDFAREPWVDDLEPIYVRKERVTVYYMLRERAAAIRKGDTNA